MANCHSESILVETERKLTAEEARKVANVINAGSLMTKLQPEPIREYNIGATPKSPQAPLYLQPKQAGLAKLVDKRVRVEGVRLTRQTHPGSRGR